MSEEKISISINGITLMVLAFSASLGYLEAGIRGLFAGIAGSALAVILALLGVIPFIGPLLYIYSYNEAAKWIKSSVAIKHALTLPYYYGLVIATIYTIITTIYLIKALE